MSPQHFSVTLQNHRRINGGYRGGGQVNEEGCEEGNTLSLPSGVESGYFPFPEFFFQVTCRKGKR